MKVLINNSCYFLHWQHNNYEELNRPKFRINGDTIIPKQQQSNTSCWIDCNKVPICEGISKLHKGDNYNKSTGRQKSLQIALSNSGFTKHERALFWEEYLKMTNKIK